MSDTNIDTNVTDEKKLGVEVNETLISMVQGVFVGAGAVLATHGKCEKLEAATVDYLAGYVTGLIAQGVTREGLGFLFGQMDIAAEANRKNVVLNIAHYLLGLVLEKLSTAGEAELT